MYRHPSVLSPMPASCSLLFLLLTLALSQNAASSDSRPTDLTSALAYATTDNDPYIKDLYQLTAIPSISALPDHSKDVEAAAEWLKQRLSSAGLENVQILPTKGAQPVVRAWAVSQNMKAVVALHPARHKKL